MKKLSSIEEILEFAIGEEQAAYEMYMDLSGKIKNAAMRAVFRDFAGEETEHKKKLMAIRKGEQLLSSEGKVQDLKISDYTVDVEAVPDMTYQDALLLAMKKEKAAFRLYSDLAAAASDNKTRTALLGLAEEEAKHKLKFEIEYDDNFMTEKY